MKANSYAGTFLIEDLSASGVLLAGDSLLKIGEEVRVLLQIQGSSRVGIRGKVIRHAERAGQHLFALSFQGGPAIDELVQRAAIREVETSAVTLVIDEDREVCHALSCELKLMGKNALGVHTPLHAIGWLHAPGSSIEGVAVGSKFAEMDGLDLLEFIALDFPSVRRALILREGELLTKPTEAAHVVLRSPWTRDVLRTLFSGAP